MRLGICAVSMLVWCATVARCDSKQQRGERLVHDAIELSDIRAEGASTFHIKATFNYGAGSTTLGNYTQTWISREQWRQEFEISSFRRIEVAKLQSRWLSDSSDDIPPEVDDLQRAINLKTLPEPAKVTKIIDKNFNGFAARCVWSETYLQIDVYCIDTKSGALLSYENLWRGGKKLHVVYVFRHYARFGDHMFPRSVQEDREGEPSIETNVTELATPDLSPGGSLFEPPPASIELTNCLPSEITPADAELAPQPRLPAGHDQYPFVILSLIVTADGKARRVRVTKSGGPDYDSEAVKALEEWRFRPARCNGKEVALQGYLSFDFHSAHRIGGVY
jgi:TonB family protein